MRLGLRLRPPAPKLQFFNTFLLEIVVFLSRLALRLGPRTPKPQIFHKILQKLLFSRRGSHSASGRELRNLAFYNKFLLEIAVFSSQRGGRLRPRAPNLQFFNKYRLKIAAFSLRLGGRFRPRAPKFQIFNKFLLKIAVFRCGSGSASGHQLRNFNFSIHSF